ncbi:hypothetical protein [Pyruvatibacter sp.]
MDILKDITVEREIVRTETTTYTPLLKSGFKFLVVYDETDGDALFCELSDARLYIRSSHEAVRYDMVIINLETGEEVS